MDKRMDDMGKAVLWAVAGGAFALMCSVKTGRYVAISASVLSGITWASFAKRIKWKRNRISALTLTVTISSCYVQFTEALYLEHLKYIFDIFNLSGLYVEGMSFLAAVGFPAMYVLHDYILQKYARVLVKWGRENKRIVCLMVIVSLVVVILYASVTSLFYNGYNGIYSMDSSRYIETNAYVSYAAGENDIRQPLFGVVGGIFYGAGNIVWQMFPALYPYIVGISNVAFLTGSFYMILRMSDVRARAWKVFLLFMTYPGILFTFSVEQYAMPTFLLVVFCYQYIRGREQIEEYWMAAGSLIISGAAAILILKKETEEKFIYFIRYVAGFFVLAMLTGRINVFFAFNRLIDLLQYTGIKTGVSLKNRVIQYLNFVWSCFFMPGTEIVSNENGSFQYVLEKNNGYWRWGLMLFLLALSGFYFNRKKESAKVCLFWIAISVIVICLVGWGTEENNLVLYSLYFGWPYWVLMMLGINNIEHGWMRKSCFIILSIFMVMFNFYGMIDIMKFGCQYYPI